MRNSPDADGRAIKPNAPGTSIAHDRPNLRLEPDSYSAYSYYSAREPSPHFS